MEKIMKKITIAPILCLAAIACNVPEKGEQVLIQDGNYTLDDIYIPSLGATYNTLNQAGELTGEIDLPDDIFDFDFTISTADMTFTWGGASEDDSETETELTTSTLIESSDWETACETDLTGVELETFNFDSDTMAFGLLEITAPLLHADGCTGDSGEVGAAILKEDKEDAYEFYLKIVE
jgi:hypothetical protein